MNSRNLTRKNDARLFFSDEELLKVHENMKKVGITNRSNYLRKMALDGFIINIDTNRSPN